MSDDVLFDSVELNDLTLDNRVGLAPMTRTSADDEGRATERMASYYAAFARGGFSFLVTEGTHPDAGPSQGYANQPGLATAEQADAWETVTDAVHEAGAPIFAQLMHAGPLVQGNRYTDESVAPSAVQPKGEQLGAYGGEGEFDTPRKLAAEELPEVRDSFVEAAERARDADFDGVELHGANGYLLDAFITEYTNQRDDKYGGSPAERVRFPAEVTEAVDDAVPEEFVVGIRLSQTKVNDEEYSWRDAEEAETIITTLVEAGVDYIHVTEADITQPAFPESNDDRTFAELAAEFADVPVIANGGLTDPDAARSAIDDGADLITLATGALANQDWPERAREGESLDEFDFAEYLLPSATLNDWEVPAAESGPADD